MTGKCSVCTSEHKEWIEEQHENGNPLRGISEELEEQFGENISHVTIGNHMNKHLGRGDRVAKLEQTVKELQYWLYTLLPVHEDFRFTTKGLGYETLHTVSASKVFLQMFGLSPDDIESLSQARVAAGAAIRERIFAELAAEEERRRIEGETARKLKEKAKALRMKEEEHRKAEEEKQRINGLRKEVSAYDNGEASK